MQMQRGKKLIEIDRLLIVFFFLLLFFWRSLLLKNRFAVNPFFTTQINHYNFEVPPANSFTTGWTGDIN